MNIASGARFDRYEVIAPLGAGGMGEVYLAEDKRLGRKVALKILPLKFTADEERLRRFRQEAQATSALNHPNIITIHEIGHVGDLHFIATEYIEGRTLRQKMAAGRLKLAEALDIAVQVTSALVAAHSAGVVHRDIKPENVMVRPDGYVKVLDFGLAKLAEKGGDDGAVGVAGDGATAVALYETRPLDLGRDLGQAEAAPGDTAPGIVMGTVQYMSPEQARGLKVDARSDLFSFGVVFYEMVAGRVPFTGATAQAVVAAILKAEAPPLGLALGEVPEVLEWIVEKALMKDRDDRYQTARELLTDLRRLKQQLDAAQFNRSRALAADAAGGGATDAWPAAAETARDAAAIKSPRGEGYATARGGAVNTEHLNLAPSTSTKKLLLSEIKQHKSGATLFGVALALLVAGFGYGLYTLLRPGRPPSPFQAMRLTRLTTTGRATRAAISPDGKYAAIAVNEAGRQSLWVRQVATTNNIEIVPPTESIYRGLTFSPDGDFIYYVVQENNNPIQRLYQVPVLGGTPRRILDDIDSPVTFSPDAKQLAFVRRYRSRGEDSIVVANADGANERRLTTRKGPDFYGISGPAWSPDGRVVAVAAGTNAGGRKMNVAAVRADTGEEKLLAAQTWFDTNRVAWLAGGDGLIVSATEQGSTLSQVWHVAYPDGRAQKVTNDLNDYRDMSLTADSRALVTVQSEAHVNVWLAPASDAARAQQITSGIGQYNGVRGIAWVPDGRIVFVSRISGSQDIWIMDADGTNQRQLTTPLTRADVYPTVTPDGRYIVFTSNRKGNSNIWRMELDGANPVQLTGGTGEEFPHAGTRADAVVYTATSSNKFTLWRVGIDGGAPTQLTDKLSQWPVVSPDGKLVACWYREEAAQPWRIAVVPFEGGPPVKAFELPVTVEPSIPVRWTADGQALTFVATKSGVSNIWRQPLDGTPAAQLTTFPNEQIFWFEWSRDGRQLALSRGVVNSDVVLISNIR
jgi:eukaryotic-like serine/threonine-protein kinase